MATLFITGEKDPKFCQIAKDLEAKMPNATHVTIKEAGHNVHLERPGPFMDAVLTFLNI